MKKISSKRKGALTIELVLIVSVLVIVAGLGIAWLTTTFNKAATEASNRVDNFNTDKGVTA